VNDNALPVVTDVFVSGSAWTQGYRDYLADNGFGDATYGYRLDAANHGDELPWVNLNRLSVRFSEDVDVEAADLALYGINVANYGQTHGFTFSYDPVNHVATWQLLPATVFFDTDKLLLDLGDGVTDINDNPLDGEWTNPATTPNPTPGGGADTFPSGDGTAGGRFRFRLNVLPGDVNRSGGILGNDVTFVRNAQGFAPGTGLYDTPFLDVNGSGGILGNDVTFTRNRQGFTLPDGEPVAP